MKLQKLNQPPLIDYSKLCSTDVIKVDIINTTYKFSSSSKMSGKDLSKNPIFGHIVYKNDIEISSSDFGLPWILIQKGSTPKISFNNLTDFTFNLHFHGLATNGFIDGVSEELVFGKSTIIGPQTNLDFPLIVNNQALIWYHSHNMFTSINLIYGGLVGLMLIEDSVTKWLSEKFIYQNNHVLLQFNDIDLDEEGIQTPANLVVDQNRSCFTLVNGKSVVNWYTDNGKAKYVDCVYHTSGQNLVKIDMLNANVNWRVYHIGVCDKNDCIKTFHVIQCDQGLLNPYETDMAFLYTGSRLSILIDLKDFVNGEAFLFFYDYDLTEVINSDAQNPELPNSALIGQVSNPTLANNTPYPVPIPSDDTNLFYPIVKGNPLFEQTLDNGFIPKPIQRYKKPVLKIIFNNTAFTKQVKPFRNALPICTPIYGSLASVLQEIRNTIFDLKNPETRKILCIPDFEQKINYLPYLNANYFYNIPTLINNPPVRNFVLFGDSDANSPSGGIATGLTEYIDGANRIICDLWNSNELDIGYAIAAYQRNPNNYKPSILPTSKFTIFETNDKYSNSAMISNDTLFVEISNGEIKYGDFDVSPLGTKFVKFPPKELMSIQDWIDTVNTTFKNTKISIPEYSEYQHLSDLIECDWSFFPYTVPLESSKYIYIKSAVILTKNKSPFTIRLNGRLMLIQFFGKALNGQTLDQPWKDQYLDSFTPCDEKEIYGILNAEIQSLWPFYATDDPSLQLPIACMTRDGELIIKPNSTFVGIYDGFYNNNLNLFTVKFKSDESWIYTNGDAADAHCLHFHLTSGFVTSQNNNDSQLNNPTYNFFYSRDIYQIGAQTSLSFYIIFPDYPSSDPSEPEKYRTIGGVIHCHFLAHTDSNGMMIQFRVDI
jgi:FtsP/CotA-like multicopper oxidase with cupredoxin domain